MLGALIPEYHWGGGILARANASAHLWVRLKAIASGNTSSNRFARSHNLWRYAPSAIKFRSPSTRRYSFLPVAVLFGIAFARAKTMIPESPNATAQEREIPMRKNPI